MLFFLKCRLYKLNRNLIITVKKDKLLQQKIGEMQKEIDEYKQQLLSVGIIYKDEKDFFEI